MEQIKLRTAATLRQEHDKQNKDRRDASYNRCMQRAIDSIEKAHREGKTEAWGLTLTGDVVNALREAGYTVRYFPAADMGDMDSHFISW